MRFTEHELTAALTGAAKTVLASKKLRKRGKDIDQAWEELSRIQRFHLLDSIGDQVLPVLVALPDVEVAAGTRASYTTEQVRETVTGLVGDEGGKLRRQVTIKARTALVETALSHLPVRLDPDGLGFLEG